MSIRRMVLLGLLLAVAGGAQARELTVVQVADFSASRAALGQAFNTGAQVWFDHVNAQGGINGNPIHFVKRDDQYRVEETLRLVREALARDKPIAFLGVLGTANTAELIRTSVLNDGTTPLVGPYTGADSLRSPVDPYIFHVRASYGDEIEKMVDQFSRTGFRRLAIFCENDAFGQAGLTAFEAATKKRGLDAGLRVVVARGASDLSGGIRQLQDNPPEGIVMATAGAVSANFIKALRDAGLHMPVIGYSVNDYSAVVKVAGPANARGTGFTQVVPDPAHCYRPVCREFDRLYRKYGPAGVSASPNTMEGFIAARILTEGLRRSGSNPSGGGLMKALETISDLDLGGFTVNFGPGNRSGSKYIDIGVLSADGTLHY